MRVPPSMSHFATHLEVDRARSSRGRSDIRPARGGEMFEDARGGVAVVVATRRLQSALPCRASFSRVMERGVGESGLNSLDILFVLLREVSRARARAALSRRARVSSPRARRRRARRHRERRRRRRGAWTRVAPVVRQALAPSASASSRQKKSGRFWHDSSFELQVPPGLGFRHHCVIKTRHSWLRP